MRILKRNYQLATFPIRLRGFIKAAINIPFTFQHPLQVFRHYLAATLPKEGYVDFQNGYRVTFSGHKHDLVSTIIVWCKKDYGTVAPGSVCCDIGANIGIFSLFSASQGAAKVYAFEANQTAYKTMVANIEHNHLNNRIHPYHYAVTDKSGEHAAFPSVPSPYNRIHPHHKGATEKVDTISLDDIVRITNAQLIDLVKMDIEGAEYLAIANVMDDTLMRIKEIRMEYHAGPLETLHSRLLAAGFRVVLHIAEQKNSGIIWFRRNAK